MKVSWGRAGRLVCERGSQYRRRRKGSLKMGGVEKGKEIFVQESARRRTAGKPATGQVSAVRSGGRQVRPLDFPTPMPTRTKHPLGRGDTDGVLGEP